MWNKDKVLRICDFLVDFSIVSIVFVLPVFFSFIYETWNIFELPKVVAFRWFLSIGVLAFLAAAFIRGEVKTRANSPLLFLSSFLLLSWILAAIFSIHPQMSFWGKYQRLQGLSSLITYLAFFWLCFLHLNSWRKIKMMLWSIVASSFFVCLYGASQFFYIDPMHWAESFEDFRRIFSTMGQPNFLGHYLIMVMPITAYCLIFLSKRFLPRSLLAILLSLQAVCLYYTWSRSAWLAFAGEIWLSSSIYLFFKYRKKLFYPFIGISVAVVLAVLTLLVIPKDGDSGFWLKNRWVSSFDLNVGSQRMRLLYASGAAKEFAGAPWQRKLFGYGQDVLSDVTVKWYEKDWGDYEKLNTWPDRVHNFFFDTLMTSGVVGVVASSAVFFYFLFLARSYLSREIKDRRYWLAVFLAISLFGYLVNNSFSFSLTPQYVYLYLLLAISFHLFLSDRPERRIGLGLTIASRSILWIAFLGFLGYFIFYKGAMAMKADYYFAAARDWSGTDNCRALEYNRLASIINPEESFYREEYIFNALNCFDGIKESEQKSVLKENIDIMLSDIPEKERWYFIKLEEANIFSVYAANVDDSYGQRAEEAFEKLLSEHPRISQVYLYYAYHKLRFRQYDSVVELTGKAEELMPKLTLPLYFLNNVHRKTLASELVRLYEMAAVASELDGEPDRAAAYYLKAVKADPYRLPAYKRLADVYYMKGDLDKAIEYNQRGYSLNRHDPSWPLAIALIFDDKKDGEAAVDYARRTLELAPNDETALKIIAKYEQ